MDYAEINAINWSTLRHIETSPLMLRWRVEHPREDTRALRLGRAIHCAVLEPEMFGERYIVEPDFGDLRTNTAKAKRAAWLAELTGAHVPRPYFDTQTKAGKAGRAAWIAGLPDGASVLIGDENTVDVLGHDIETLTADEHALALRCAEAVRSHARASDMLRGGRTEEIVTWTDEETSIACKARLDLITPAYVLDLKSLRAATLSQINREIASYLYHGQVAFYHDGATAAGLLPPGAADGPYVLAVQTVEPYDVVPMRLSRDDLDAGRGLYRRLLRRYAECCAADWWPGLASDVIETNLPAWAAAGDREEEQEMDW